VDCHTAFVLQNGHDEYVRQFIDEAASLYRLQNDTFYIRTNNGCIPTSIYKEYRPLDESTFFSAVYSELKSVMV
jgi:hypothetical protein